MNPIAAEYAARTPGSRAMWERARAVMPGGDTRTCVFFHPHPVSLARGEGTYLWDVDGNRYVDLNSNGMSIIHGHAFEPTRQALVEPPRAAPPGRARTNRRCASPSC